MKRNIAYIFIALFAMVVVSCTKDADVVEVEKKLPPMSISSFGLAPYLTSPFTVSATVQNTLTFNFGASATGVQPGSFDLAFYETTDTKAKPVFTDSVHFDAWSGKDATKAFSITSKSIPTTYPNTSVYQGSVTWKLNNKFVAGKKYTVRAYVRPAGNTNAYTPYQLGTTNLLTIK